MAKNGVGMRFFVIRVYKMIYKVEKNEKSQKKLYFGESDGRYAKPVL